MANNNLLKKYLSEFTEVADEWFEEAKFLEERYTYFKKFFDKENLEKCKWSDIQLLGNNLHCFTTNALAKKRAFGKMNHTLEYYRESLLYLAHGKDSPKDRINNVSEKTGKHRLKFISDSAISELIGYIMPEKYTFYNSRSKEALKLLGIDLPKRNESLGDTFEIFSSAIGPIKKLYETVVGKKTSLPLSFEIDQFFSFLYEEHEGEIGGDDITLGSSLGEVRMNTHKQKDRDVLNKVLYGPPGTGKTYRVVEEALRIVLTEDEQKNLNWKDRTLMMQKFNELKAKNYIGMVTFHQSYSYEDFVEGIRPEVSKDNKASFLISDGVFKEFVNNSNKENEVENKPFDQDLSKTKIYKISLGNTLVEEENEIYEYCIQNGRIAIGYGGELDFSSCNDRGSVREKLKTIKLDITNNSFDITAVNFIKNILKKDDLVIVSDGNRKFRAIGRLKSDKYVFQDDSPFPQQREVEWLKVFKESLPVQMILNCNFSQMSIYEFFTHKLKMDALKELLSESSSTVARNYVFIIDEINRGNISKIFGELITLLEKDKRKNTTNGIPITLPYSKKDFIIPENVYIIGTMNTADRSIAMIDIALRRRFQFIEVSPDESLVKDIEGVRLQEIFKIVNRKIALLLGRDFRIGHSYFMNGNAGSIMALRDTWFTSILPLIHEYFYDEPKKIKELVGSFIQDEEKVRMVNDDIYFDGDSTVEFILNDESLVDGDFVARMNKLIN